MLTYYYYIDTTIPIPARSYKFAIYMGRSIYSHCIATMNYDRLNLKNRVTIARLPSGSIKEKTLLAVELHRRIIFIAGYYT